MKSYSNKLFSDKRLDYTCCYCGEGPPSTKDHVPSRILLDDPFPENLPLVGCCLKCNNSFSKDEEYFAAVIECIIHSASEPDLLSREKIKKVLRHNTKLRKRIASSYIDEGPLLFEDVDAKTYFRVETERFDNVLTKLAKGHVKFEHGTPMFENPDIIWYNALQELAEEEFNLFFNVRDSLKVADIGSRAFFKTYIDNNNETLYGKWEVVQEGRYAYCVSDDLGQVSVRIIISDYLACLIVWE